MKIPCQLVALVLSSSWVGTSAWSQNMAEWTVCSGGNGHVYEVVYAPGGVDWSTAHQLASQSGSGAALATIRSAAENAFVYNLVYQVLGGPLQGTFGPWLGGVRTNSSGGPASGWNWISGETWNYTAWGAGEPSGDILPALHFKGVDPNRPIWNDLPRNTLLGGYVVEHPNVCAGPTSLGAATWSTCGLGSTVEGNGHHYEVFSCSQGIDWNAASRFAESQGGYLATLTSAGESGFVWNLVQRLPQSRCANGGRGPWIGGLKNPLGVWEWVTSEPWSYTNWSPGEPSGGEDRLQIKGNDTGSMWNDLPGQDRLPAFVVEYGPILAVAPETFFWSLGGMATFEIDARPIHAGCIYLLMLSSVGPCPGIALGGTTRIPVNFDFGFTMFGLTNPNGYPFSSYLGMLDAVGKPLVPPALTIPPIPGGPPLELTHTFLVMDSFGILAVSPAVSVQVF